MPSSSSLRQVGAPLAVLALSLSLSFTAWAIARREGERHEQLLFQIRCDDVQAVIERRLELNAQRLRSAAGLFAAQGSVSREAWRRFVSALELERHAPGIQGMGYTQRVLPHELAAHVARIRAQGFPDYRIWPASPRQEYLSIVYLEPFNWRNWRAFGYDMATEPTRREALQRARDTGRIAMSGKVRLVQETDRDVQAGFLLYQPVYRSGAPIATVAQRRAALSGFVYSPFRADDLFRAIFAYQPTPTLGVAIYDGERVEASALLHDHGHASASERQAIRRLVQAGRTWTLVYRALPSPDGSNERRFPDAVALAGLLVSASLTGITWLLASGRQRAEEEVQRRTQELRRQAVEVEKAHAAHDLATREKLAALEEASKQKDQFLSILSHELRTPINAVMGFGSILEDGLAGPLNPGQQHYVRKMLDGADILLALIDDLLVMSRIQAGKFSLSPVSMRLEATLEEAIATLAPLAAQKGLALESELPELPPLVADPQRVRQIALNLLSNAIKFTPSGGRIRVRARQDGDWLRCEVADTGIGISAEAQAQLFQPFMQVDMSTTRPAGGSGLGLSISKALVKAHGGQIGLQSEPGRGSCFWFALPLLRHGEPEG